MPIEASPDGSADRQPRLYPAVGHPNPLYGVGVFRRRVRLTSAPGLLTGELEDCSHGFRLYIEHNEAHVSSIAAEALRIPLSTCHEAIEPLRRLVGCPLNSTWDRFRQQAPASANCTHLHDLAWWLLAHAGRSTLVRDYEIAITDETADPSVCSVWRDGALVIRLYASLGTVVAPRELADRSLLRGFSAWAREHFPPDDFEAAVMLQRGYFVAQARRRDKRASAGKAVLSFQTIRGACFSYSAGAVERATVTADSERDFTHRPDLLLQFR